MRREAHGSKSVLLAAVVLGLLAWFPGLSRPAVAASLWLGNDTSGSVFQTNVTGGVLQQLPALPITGVAFDGTHLYLSSATGTISQRTADGLSEIKSFTISPVGSPTEDLAWDTKRQRLWRIEHNPPTLRMINPVTGMAEATFSIPPNDPKWERSRGGLGIAYDPTKDRLYVSFCPAGCASITIGLVLTVNPDTGAVENELFRTDGFAAGGLGFDPLTDTLWVGDVGTVRNMSLTGMVGASFARPQPGGFVDGLEFIVIQAPAFQYAAKFVCGKSDGEVVARGTYLTAINVHNPTDEATVFRKKFAIALPDEKSGPVSKFLAAKLGPDEALEIDCRDIVRHTHTTAGFLKGFAVIESRVELDVVAVYTAAGATGQVETLQIERVSPRRRKAEPKGLADLVPVPDPRPGVGFCKLDGRGRLVVTVKNQGIGDAPASTTRVDFSPGGPFALPTPAIPAGGSVDLAPLSIPGACYNPDCDFRITVDSNDQINESNEGNNHATGNCLG